MIWKEPRENGSNINDYVEKIFSKLNDEKGGSNINDFIESSCFCRCIKLKSNFDILKW